MIKPLIKFPVRFPVRFPARFLAGGLALAVLADAASGQPIPQAGKPAPRGPSLQDAPPPLASAGDSRHPAPTPAGSGGTARKVDPPARFAGGLAALNEARARAGQPPVVWSLARAEDAQEALATLAGRSCTSSAAERLGIERDLASYWAPATRLLDGTGQPQDIASGYVVSRWAAERSRYDPATGCASKGDCENYSRLIRPAARSVGCAVTICPEGTQVWACKFGD